MTLTFTTVIIKHIGRDITLRVVAINYNTKVPIVPPGSVVQHHRVRKVDIVLPHVGERNVKPSVVITLYSVVRQVPVKQVVGVAKVSGIENKRDLY